MSSTLAYWTCSRCDAVNDAPASVCENCGLLRAASRDTGPPATAQTCARCSGISPSTNVFHDDSAPEDRGVRLCPACWIPALRRRAHHDPIPPEALRAGLAAIRALAARYDIPPPVELMPDRAARPSR